MGWCEGLPFLAPPLPSSLFLFWPPWPSSFPSLSLYFGHLSIDVTCLLVPFQPRPPPCTRAVTSRGPTSSELPGLGDRRVARGGFRDHRSAGGSAGASPELRWQPRRCAGWRGWAHGGPGQGDRGGMWCGVQKCLHSWGSPQRLVPWTVPCPDSQIWDEDGGECPGTDPPRAQGKVGSWGSPQDSCQCLQPTSRSLE